MNRDEVTAAIVSSRLAKGLTWQEIADALGKPVVWTTAALLGQHPFSASEARHVAQILELPDSAVPVLTAVPYRGGLPTAVPRCIVAVRLDSRVEGVGVDPRQPPLRWEAWDGAGWQPCEVGTDTTGGLNRAGEVVLYVPAAHTASVVGGTRAGWLRCPCGAASTWAARRSASCMATPNPWPAGAFPRNGWRTRPICPRYGNGSTSPRFGSSRAAIPSCP